MSGTIPPGDRGAGDGDSQASGRVPVWVPVLGVVLALVVGGVVGALIADDESEDDATQAGTALSVAAADVDYALAVQRLRSAVREYAAVAAAVGSQVQAERAQAALQRQEEEMQAVAEAARQRAERRSQVRRAAAERLTALADASASASQAAQERREAAATGGAAVGALQAYARQLGQVGARLEALLAQLAEAQGAAEVEAVLAEILDELERLAATAEEDLSAGGDATTPDG